MKRIKNTLLIMVSTAAFFGSIDMACGTQQQLARMRQRQQAGGPLLVPPPVYGGPVVGGPVVGGPVVGGPVVGGPGGGMVRGGPPPLPGGRGGPPPLPGGLGGGAPVLAHTLLGAAIFADRVHLTQPITRQDAETAALATAPVGTNTQKATWGRQALVLAVPALGLAAANSQIIDKAILRFLEREPLVVVGGNTLAIFDAIEALGTPLSPVNSALVATNAVLNQAAGSTRVQNDALLAAHIPLVIVGGVRANILNAALDIVYPPPPIVGAVHAVGAPIAGVTAQRIADILATIAHHGGAIQAAILADVAANAVQAALLAGGAFPGFPANEAEAAAYAVLTAPPLATKLTKRNRAIDMLGGVAPHLAMPIIAALNTAIP